MIGRRVESQIRVRRPRVRSLHCGIVIASSLVVIVSGVVERVTVCTIAVVRLREADEHKLGLLVRT